MKLSIIYAIETEDFESSAVSFLSQLPAGQAQFLMIDRVCSEQSKQTAAQLKAKFSAAEYFEEPTASLAALYNRYAQKASGESVNFSNSHLTCDPGTISAALAAQQSDSIVGCVSRDSGSYTHPKLFEAIGAKERIAFEGDPMVADLFFCGYFFDKIITEAFRFDESIIDDECGTFFILDIALHVGEKCGVTEMVLLRDATIMYDEAYAQRAIDRFGSHDPRWYTPIFKEKYIPLLQAQQQEKGAVPMFLQLAVFYSIAFRFLTNMDGRNTELLIGEDLEEFLDTICDTLQFLDDSVITRDSNFCQYRITYKMAWLLSTLKYRRNPEKLHLDFDIANNKVFALINGYTYNISSALQVQAMNYAGGELTMDMSYMYSQLFDLYPDCLHAYIDGKEVPLEVNGIYSMTKYFTVPGFKRHTFYLKTKVNPKKKTVIRFVIELKNKKFYLPLNFTKPGARLTNTYPHAYWAYKDITMFYTLDKTLVITPRNKRENFKKEIHFFIDLLRFSLGSFKIKMPLIRLLYWLLYPIYGHRRIWLYFDKLYKGGDNGEYAITYASRQKDKIHHYYVLNADSYDFKRIKKKGIKMLKFNSLRHKLMSLYAENIVATHPDIMWFCGYSIILEHGFRDKFSGNIICIAHGITIQKNAEVQCRSYDNTQFYTTTSKYEVAHIKKPAYGYYDDEIALTGLARFDGLKSNDQKQILITPTWRKSVCGTGMLNETKGYNPLFKQSAYYRVYNQLINDERLIACAEKTGYKHIFLLHPAMSAQIDDYDTNDYVELIQASGDMSYEKILTESSLMVTDYSGVQYDFAYQRKPLVYYHPSALPPRFEEGALKYDTMGFGPICTKNDEIVDTLCRYMEAGCQIEEEYRRRADDFFAFDDFNNSERIYKAILAFTEKMKH